MSKTIHHQVTMLLASVATLAIGSAAAQSNEGEIAGKITFYTHFSQFVDSGQWDEWAAAFEAKYFATEVEVLPVSNYRKEMATRIASGDYGDVLNVLDNLPPSDYATFYASLTDMDLADTHQFVDCCTVDGEIYGYAMASTPRPWFTTRPPSSARASKPCRRRRPSSSPPARR